MVDNIEQILSDLQGGFITKEEAMSRLEDIVGTGCIN